MKELVGAGKGDADRRDIKAWNNSPYWKQREAWIRTATGGKVFFFAPEKSQITIEDIAHGLALVCRFNGACQEFYSVAQHCCIIHDQLPDNLKLQGLMHDGSEAFLSDVPKPFKEFFEGYKEAEGRFEEWLANKYGYQYPYDPLIKEHDVRALATEMRDLMLFADIETEPYPFKIEPWDWRKAKEEFLTRFYKLNGPDPVQ